MALEQVFTLILWPMLFVIPYVYFVALNFEKTKKRLLSGTPKQNEWASFLLEGLRLKSGSLVKLVVIPVIVVVAIRFASQASCYSSNRCCCNSTVLVFRISRAVEALGLAVAKFGFDDRLFGSN